VMTGLVPASTNQSEVNRIFETMEYGPAPEAANVAKVSIWLFFIATHLVIV